MPGFDITVGGRWLPTEGLYGDAELSTVWPGGSDELSWTPGTQSAHRFAGGELVVGYVGPVPKWRGRLTEPDPSQDQLTARGLFRDGEDFMALDGSSNVTTVPDTAIDAAIARGLAWTRPASLSTAAAAVDVSQGPVTLGSLLDSWAEEAGVRWGVNPLGEVYAKADDTTPTWQTLPLTSGLGYALDHYASTLIGRYYNGTTYATATRTNTAAEKLHGHVEAPVDLTPRGTITSTKANQILDNLLALGRAVPQWTDPIEVTYGEILSLGGTAVMLETVAAGGLLRIPGEFDLAWRGGATFLDIPIGRTTLSDGALTIQPLDMAVGTLADALTAALSKS